MRCASHCVACIYIPKLKYEVKYIPLANLKNTPGIVAFCKDAKEIVVANRNGLPKLVLTSREAYENGLGRLTDRVLLNAHRDMELIAEPVLIRTFNNPAEIVRICKKEMGKVIPVLRNGVDEIYAMDYESYLVRKACFLKVFETS